MRVDRAVDCVLDLRRRGTADYDEVVCISYDAETCKQEWLRNGLCSCSPMNFHVAFAASASVRLSSGVWPRPACDIISRKLRLTVTI